MGEDGLHTEDTMLIKILKSRKTTGSLIKFRYSFELPLTLVALRIEGHSSDPHGWATVEFCAPLDVTRLREWIEQNIHGEHMINSVLNEVVYFKHYDDAMLCYMAFK